MWRDLEDENVARNNKERLTVGGRQEKTDIYNDNISCTSLTESHGNGSMGDFGELGENYFDTQAWSGLSSPDENEVGDSSIFEMERPRLIFQELENNGERGHASSTPRINKSPRTQCPGENEHERVSVIRGSEQLKSQRRESCSDSTHSQTTELWDQIETVPDRLIINHNEGRTNHMQRRIRRLCGRQALVDMLAKAETERQRELQGLLECRVVSQFPHRIQSLLKSRFLRNMRVVEEPRQKSTAASELGLLMQRQTVSGLREGFITRLDKSVNGESSNQIDTSSDGISNAIINEEAQGSSSRRISDETYEQCDNTNKKRSSDIVDDLEVHTSVERRNGEDLNGHEEALDNHGSDDHIASMNLAAESVDGNREISHSVESTQEIPRNEVLENNQQQETREAVHGTSGSRTEEKNFYTSSVNDSRSQDNNIHTISELLDDSESTTSASANSEESTSQADRHELAAHNDDGDDDDRDLQQNTTIGSSDQYNDVGEETNTDWQGNTVNGSSRDMTDEERSQLENQPDMNEHADDSEESAEDWVDRSYQLEAIPVSRSGSFYPHDDDNAQCGTEGSLERRVSNLLQSGFRESLDRLLQSYADRQSNAPIDWEAEHDPPSEDQNDVSLDTYGSPSVQTPPQATQRLLDQVLNQDNWSRNSMRQLDWDIINDLRIDLSGLHHRMDSLQKMLETCMDMQLELQRSIRQEVSAALNRSFDSSESADTISNKSRWDNVRKGICCMCCENNIDSLLYRCGHTCTCSNCANQLVQDKGKCPMCQAPVIELIRTYSI